MILPKNRDPRFTIVRRGGLLSDGEHRALALWAARCSGHVLHLFEDRGSGDDRPRRAIEAAEAWSRGEIRVTEAKVAAYHANAAARDLVGGARLAAYSAGQAAVVAHVPAHYLGAAAYAIRAVKEAGQKDGAEAAGRAEWEWQMETLPTALRALVLEDEMNRNEICWKAFYV